MLYDLPGRLLSISILTGLNVKDASVLDFARLSGGAWSVLAKPMAGFGYNRIVGSCKSVF